MPIYKGSTKVKDIYMGSDKIKEVYKGSTLVYSIYKDGQVIFDSSTPGTYSRDILVSGIYEVYVVGGGAGSNAGYHRTGTSSYIWYYGFTGGSGSAFVGRVRLTSGTYSIVVGAGSTSNHGSNTVNKDVTIYAAGNSSIGTSVTAYGGRQGFLGQSSTTANPLSYGGVAPVVNVPIISTTTNVAGNNGRLENTSHRVEGGASVYGGYGAGGAASYDDYANAGGSGYVKIVYRRA